MPYCASGFSARWSALLVEQRIVFHTSCFARTSFSSAATRAVRLAVVRSDGGRSVCSISTCLRSVR